MVDFKNTCRKQFLTISINRLGPLDILGIIYYFVSIKSTL